MQGLRRMLLDSVYHQLCQFNGSGTSFDKSIVYGKAYTRFFTMVAHQGDFLFGVVRIAVERHNHRLPERAQVFDVLIEVGETLLQAFHVRFFDFIETYTAVHFQALCRGYNHGQLRLKSRLAALDVVELLCTQVGAESGFGNDVFAERHGKFRSQDRIASVGNVGERTAMYNRRRMFGGLHQIGRNSVFQQDRNRTSHAQVFHRKRFVIHGKT